ncbi:S8 family serine peptidase [Pseudoalteromonas sp. G4]|uniref:S8 family serine peptidase n=1 Tax=Pseudoalteromonas sp. G4 TaxID=2992761 RepID=UPI00237ECC60|nr:S8 family serine peptidase [Pseudoalteromonas sp. G4]MDE3271962.1 S8 family serine peptidase [Pseudoalteromonas sp. G4]
MTTFGTKRTLIALSVASAIASTAVNASTLKQLDYVKPSNFDSSLVKNASHKEIRVVTGWLIQLKTPSIAQVTNARTSVSRQAASIMASQSIVESAIQSMDLNLTIVAKTSKLVNGLLVTGDRKDVEQLKTNHEVKEIFPIYDSELHVADSADYIKATPVVAAGIASGENVKVAVLDTGIDYTHAAFGGEGTAEAYAAAAQDPMDEVSWPQGQVKGGYDFYALGDGDDKTFPDPDPIDAGTSHGTHVAHSVSGIAPNVELYAYAVCRGGCPGISQAAAIEAAMDPNGDGDISDRVDVINMSLGGSYGDIATQRDAVSLLINEASKLGTSVVISAGNDGAYPFIVGGPSTTENALSVGAMTHPTDERLISSGTINGEEAIIQTASFGPQEAYSLSNTDLEVVYPDTNQTACEAFVDGTDFTGKAVVLDRGDCAFVTKVLMAQEKGAAFVFIANNNDDGTPAPMGGSSTEVTIPSVGLTYQAGMALKESGVFSIDIEVVVTSGAIASFTSRGPSMNGLLKPEITAPGVNIMTAHPGTGDGLSGATGTSFSGPITAGAISILKEALPARNAFERKATLMNTANLDVTMAPRATNPDTELAPISYIGAGLVDVEKAVALPVAAWAKDTRQAALSFGLVNLSESTNLTKTVEIKNFSSTAKTYSLSFSQRFADDMERGALSFAHPETITVPAGQTVEFDVTLTIDPAKLPEWNLDALSVADAASTTDLTTLELDGALEFSEGGEKAFHLVYHVLPKAAAKMAFEPVKMDSGVAQMVKNVGAATVSPSLVPVTVEDTKGDSDEALDIVAGSIETFATSACPSGYITAATMVLADGLNHSFAGGFMVDFDVDQDGVYDVTMQNDNYEFFARPGEVLPPLQVTWTHTYNDWGHLDVQLLGHSTGSDNLTLYACADAFGVTAENIGQVTANVRFRIENSIYYYTFVDSLDDAKGEYTFAPAQVIAQLQTAEGNIVESLASGESAYMAHAGQDFMILSDTISTTIATPMADARVAPMLADAEFSIAENSENGTVIGMLDVSFEAQFANPVAEFIVVNQTSTAIKLDKQSGEITVADKSVLDYEAGLTEIEMEVVVADTAGNISEPAMVKIMVTDVNENPLPEPVTPPKTKKSSGSFGWLALLAAPLAFIRRRKMK